MSCEIIYFDNHLILANKSSNLLTQAGEEESLEDLVKKWMQKTYQKKGSIFLHAVHRIDKEVSGLVLFAKTSKALSRLNEQMRDKKIQKTYVALVEGVVAEKTGDLIHYHVHMNHKAAVYSEKKKGSKPASLSFKVIEYRGKTTLLEIDLKTGRYHQIRAQLSKIGHPIVGDQKYGSSMRRKRIYLHHTKMSFLHPTTKEQMEFVSQTDF